MYCTMKYYKDGDISIMENICYFRENIDDYVKKFEERRLENVIRGTMSFYENTWRLSDEVSNLPITFEIDEISFRNEKITRQLNFNYDDLINALKCFILITLDNYSIPTIYSFFRFVKSIFKITKYFNDSYSHEIVRMCRIATQNSFYLKLQLDFLDYFEELNISDRVYNVIEKEISVPSEINIRILPSFESMFKMDEVMRNFLDNTDNEQLLKFYPVVLWWYISTRLPIRTTEFTLIPYDCIDKIGNKRYLKVRRSRLKGSRNSNENINLHSIDSNYSKHDVEITSRIYELIERYKLHVDSLDYIENFYGNNSGKVGQRKYLLSYRGYFSSILRPSNRVYTANTRINKDYLCESVLRNLLNQFYAEVVSKKYKMVEKMEMQELEKRNDCFDRNSKRELQDNEIERIHLMDTRHMAIISMMLQDIPLIAIKELAGHKTIETTCGYADQIVRYVENYTYYLSRKYVNGGEKVNFRGGSIRTASISKNLYFLEKIESGEVMASGCNNNRGWCILQEGECNYPEDCDRGCNHYISKLENVYRAQELANENIDKVSTSVKVIKEIIKNRKIISEYENRIQVEMSKIKTYVEQNKLILESMENG